MTTTNQTKVKLSQWDALQLESLRALGWSDEELLLRVREGRLPEDDSMFHFDYQELAQYAAAEPETFHSAVTQGYQIKYNTVRGIRSWILVAFGRDPELELEEGQEAVNAELTQGEREQLAAVLSFGWAIHGEHQGPAGERSRYRIAPLQR